jgi:class 3 adenylate cyclase
MEPQIRYARTSDGVNIAWYSVGAGAPPYLWCPGPFSDLTSHWRSPEMRNRLEQIVRRVRLVAYTPRGFGLSDRGRLDFSCEAMVRDIEAVAEATALAPCTFQASGYMAIPALAYAAEHPERVLALNLTGGILSGMDMPATWKALVRLANEDWGAAARMLALSNLEQFSFTSTLQEEAELVRDVADADSFEALHEAIETWDASTFVGRVTTPAFVTNHPDWSSFYPTAASRRLAAALPNGSFASVVPGPGESPNQAESRIVRGWLRDVLPRPEPSRTELPSGTAVILFTDIAQSAALTERLGDDAFRAAARELDGRLRAAIREANGTPIEGKRLGDGLLATFSSARDALGAARRCVELSADSELRLHVGLHAGDITREGGDVFGGAVNIASRICDLCEPGEVLVSQTVRDLARTSAGAAFDDRGDQQLKGIADPVRVFAVREGG